MPHAICHIPLPGTVGPPHATMPNAPMPLRRMPHATTAPAFVRRYLVLPVVELEVERYQVGLD